MTDSKLVLFLFFAVAFGLNALSVPVPFADFNDSTSAFCAGQTVVGTPSDLNQKKQNLLKAGKVQSESSGRELASGKVPELIRKTFSHYTLQPVQSNQKDLFLPIMCQGPPLNSAS